MDNKLLVILILFTFGFILAGFIGSADQQTNEWISLFNGKTLEGWKAAEHPDTFSIEDGTIKVHGPRAHLFYVGSVQDHNFDNFEFKADIKTTKGSNSGIFFHTEYQESGWPSNGYEAQVNNTYANDWRRTASLYGVDDIKKTLAKDNKWFTMSVRVKGQEVIIKVDGETVIDYTEPDDVDRGENVLSSGTFALQGHDPESKVYFKNIKVKPL